MRLVKKICANCDRHESIGSWGGIPVCEACSTLADLVKKRNEGQLKAMVTLSNDLIRVKLAEGRLTPGDIYAETPGARLHKKLQNQVRELQPRGGPDNGEAVESGVHSPTGPRG